MDNPLLNRSKAPKKKNNKKSKSSSPAVKSTPPALSPGETDHSTPENDEEEAEVDLFDLLNQQLEISAESEPVAAAASSAPSNGISQLAGGDKKPSRQQSRKNKAADALQAIKVQAEQEVELENDQSIAIERSAIKASCASLGVEVKEIRPDGHCLYNSVADQSNLLGLTQKKESYQSIRDLTAEYMRSHPDEFINFLVPASSSDDGIMGADEFERYCNRIQKTAEWGGQPEILAISKSLAVPIHVVQAGTEMIKVGNDDLTSTAGKGPILISYHRKMFGLGEHYNSLIPTKPADGPVRSTADVEEVA